MSLVASFLTPESVDWVEGSIGWWRRVGQGQSDAVSDWELLGDRCVLINGRELSVVKVPDGIGPGLEGTIDEPSVHPGGDLVQLHPRVVGGVASTEVVAVPEEGDDPLRRAVGVVDRMTFGHADVLVLWSAASSLGIQHFLHNLLTCKVQRVQ